MLKMNVFEATIYSSYGSFWLVTLAALFSVNDGSTFETSCWAHQCHFSSKSIRGRTSDINTAISDGRQIDHGCTQLFTISAWRITRINVGKSLHSLWPNRGTERWFVLLSNNECTRAMLRNHLPLLPVRFNLKSFVFLSQFELKKGPI